MPERRQLSEPVLNDKYVMCPQPPEDLKLMVYARLQGHHEVDIIRRVLDPADINLGRFFGHM